MGTLTDGRAGWPASAPVPDGSIRALPTQSREELLHNSECTRVRRIWPSDGTGALIRKEALGPGSVDRAAAETALLNRLDGLPGVARAAGISQPGSVIMIDSGGRDAK